MTGRGTAGGVAQAVAHRLHLRDAVIQIVGLRKHEPSVNPKEAAGREHSGDFIERKAGAAPQSDELQPPQYVLFENTA